MKLFVKASYHIADPDTYILFVKFNEGDKIKPGDNYLNESDPGLSFVVKSLIIGAYNYQDKSFQITIEKPAFPIDQLNEKTFFKS